MIRIQMDSLDEGLELVARGHADFAPSGRDIVCAGVSALLYGYVAYLECLSPVGDGGEADPHLLFEEGEGYLHLRTRGLGGGDLLGWRVTAAGLALICRAFPDYLEICDGTRGGEAEEGKKPDTTEKGERTV